MQNCSLVHFMNALQFSRSFDSFNFQPNITIKYSLITKVILLVLLCRYQLRLLACTLQIPSRPICKKGQLAADHALLGIISHRIFKRFWMGGYLNNSRHLFFRLRNIKQSDWPFVSHPGEFDQKILQFVKSPPLARTPPPPSPHGVYIDRCIS